jgi:RHS repeat-associated protein
MNNPTSQSSPALRIEALSINCILLYASWYATNRNLLTLAESLTAHYVEYLLLLRLIILIHLTRRNAQRITMITDGRGNVIAGGNNGGKSHISYKPYGDIHRTDSSGPDITRFKYTGQEEDRESGLLYYKARYYDPMIGRFLQADSIVMPQSSFGMNRYMYVEGNPVRWSDRSGHIPSKT